MDAMTWSAASASGDWTARLSRAKLATGSRQPHAGEASPREPSTSFCEWAFSLPRDQPLERLELIHSVGNLASCRVAEKAGFRFSAVLPPLLPDFPDDGHLHVRLAG